MSNIQLIKRPMNPFVLSSLKTAIVRMDTLGKRLELSSKLFLKSDFQRLISYQRHALAALKECVDDDQLFPVFEAEPFTFSLDARLAIQAEWYSVQTVKSDIAFGKHLPQDKRDDLWENIDLSEQNIEACFQLMQYLIVNHKVSNAPSQRGDLCQMPGIAEPMRKPH